MQEREGTLKAFGINNVFYTLILIVPSHFSPRKPLHTYAAVPNPTGIAYNTIYLHESPKLAHSNLARL